MTVAVTAALSTTGADIHRVPAPTAARTAANQTRGHRYRQWCRQDFVTGGGSEVWVYRGSRVRSPPVPVVLSVYQRGSLLDGLAMYLKKFHNNESTHILHNIWTSTHREGSFHPSSPLAAPLTTWIITRCPLENNLNV